MAKKKIIYGGKKWACTKVKGKDMLICSPSKKPQVHYHRKKKGHRKHK